MMCAIGGLREWTCKEVRRMAEIVKPDAEMISCVRLTGIADR